MNLSSFLLPNGESERECSYLAFLSSLVVGLKPDKHNLFFTLLSQYDSYFDASHQSCWPRALFVFGLISLLSNKRSFDWHSVVPLKSCDITHYSQLPKVQVPLTSQLAVIKLSGGLGTTMGCDSPKALIDIDQGRTFMDITLQHLEDFQSIHNVECPISFMTSYATHDAIESAPTSLPIQNILQHMLPRIKSADYAPFSTDPTDLNGYNPPGHGDLFYTLYDLQLIEDWLNQGIEYVFISNIDNVCAVPDMNILNGMIQTDAPFIMEVAERSECDKKGGAVVHNHDRLLLMERAQVPDDHIDQFEDIGVFQLFNTNNIWINLRFLKKWLHSAAPFLDPIFNRKHIEGEACLQLEFAMGSLINHIPSAMCVLVDRSRFFPVKTTTDLLKLRHHYAHGSHAALHCITIRLSDHFRVIHQFNELVKHVPFFKEADSITIEGPVSIEENVVFEGHVRILSDSSRNVLKNVTLKDTCAVFNDGQLNCTPLNN